MDGEKGIDVLEGSKINKSFRTEKINKNNWTLDRIGSSVVDFW